MRATHASETVADTSTAQCAVEQARALCEAHLARLVSGSSDPTEPASLSLSEGAPSRTAPKLNCPEPLSAAIVHTLLGSSKRARAVLTLLTVHGFGVDQERALSSAAALEMLHAASLILDDLPAMDDAQMRRGKPANHLAHGEDTAILASIGLINLAYHGVNADNGLTPDQRSRISLILSQAVGPSGLTGGQYDDLRSDKSAGEIARIEDIHLRKTALLFAASTEIGAIVARQDTHAEALRAFGEAIGLAFQAFDDLLDAAAQPEALGKDVGKDAAKATVIELAGLEKAHARGEAHMATARKSLQTVPKPVADTLLRYSRDLVDGMKANASGDRR
ncbi:MAG: polyprenyl synthetase family protein [Pseudomonadota bacterium]